MSSVFVMHGVVDSFDPGRLVHRNAVDSERFDAYLRKRRHRFVSLQDALCGDGDALSIDDGIRCCERAAILARNHGHEVTLFVNPSQIQSQLPYWFSVLNVAIDVTPRERTVFGDREFPLTDAVGKHAFRSRVKSAVCKLSDEIRFDFVQRVAADLGVINPPVPDDFLPSSPESLLRLVDAGVTIGNHGWTHREPAGMEPAEVWRNIELGKSWLRTSLQVESHVFAVPFGEGTPPGDPSDPRFDTWLLDDARYPRGKLADQVFNRTPLTNGDLHL